MRIDIGSATVITTPSGDLNLYLLGSGGVVGATLTAAEATEVWMAIGQALGLEVDA